MQKHVSRKQLVRELDEGSLLRIFVHLPLRTVARCAVVCKFWNKVIGTSSWLWRMLYLKNHKGVTLKAAFITGLSKQTPSLDVETSRDWKSRAVQEEQCACLVTESFSALPWKAHTGRVNCCRMMMDNIASGSSDRTIRVWSVRSRQCLEEYTLPKSAPIIDLEFDTGKLIGIAGGDILIWRRVGKRRLLRHIHSHTQLLYSMCHVDPEIFVGCEDGTIRTFDLYSGGCSLIIRQHTEAVTGVGMDVNTHLLASCSRDSTVKLCDALSGENVATLSSRVSRAEPSCLQLLSDSLCKLVVGTASGRLHCWDMRMHRLLWESKVSNTAITSIHQPPYGANVVAVGGLDGIVRVVDCISSQVVKSIARNTNAQPKNTIGYESRNVHSNPPYGCFTISSSALQTTGGSAESHSIVQGASNISNSKIGMPNRSGPPILCLRLGMARLVSAHPDGTLALWQFGIP